MSNISRRDFLKTAGVMTLAVAAAGVLAGCEGNNPVDPEKPVVTGNSVTVGDYTLTINDTKLYAVKHYNSDETKPNKVTSEDRYVVVLGNLMNNKPDTTNKPQFGLTFKNENVTDAVSNAVTIAGVKKLCDLSVNPIKWQNGSTFGEKAVANATPNGTPVFWAYKVDKVTYADGTETFKTPAITFVANDTEGKVYTKISAVIPTEATVVTEKQLQGKE